jgi:hypothetical protein
MPALKPARMMASSSTYQSVSRSRMERKACTAHAD